MDEDRLKTWLEAYRRSISWRSDGSSEGELAVAYRMSDMERGLKEWGVRCMLVTPSVCSAMAGLGIAQTYSGLDAYLRGEPEAVYRA